MAISNPHYRALRYLAASGEISNGCRLLEIGEANWWGDIPIDIVFHDIDLMKCEQPDALKAELKRILVGNLRYQQWDLVKFVYKVLFAPSMIRSIDMDGTPAAAKTDLNYEVEGYTIYQLCINHGTAEHIFNIANVFKAMHDNCCVGGLMIHEAPFTGWVDHGFYTLQPTLFYDVAAANAYEIRYLAIESIERRLLQPIESREQIHELARHDRIPPNSLLFVAMRKTNDDEFKIPQQGVYAKNVSQKTMEAWRALR